MRGPIPYTCNVCGAPKQETNHWFLGQAVRGPALVGATYKIFGVKIVAWDETLARKDFMAHLCGEGCAGKYLSETLGKIKGEQL